MTLRNWVILVTATLIGAVMASCGGVVPDLRISSIESQPKIADKGGSVVFTIAFANRAEAGSFTDVTLEVTYAEYLHFRDASPGPARENSNERLVFWELGTLPAGEEGSIDVAFEVERAFPTSVYELPVTASISGQISGGTPVAHSLTETAMITGHPTPTPTPTSTPMPTSTPTPTEVTGPGGPGEIGIICGAQFPIGEFIKPPLNIATLPPPPNPLLMNDNRIIGFAFAEGRLGLIASPAAADCEFTDPSLGRAVGTVYTLVDPNDPLLYIVSIVPEVGIGYLLDGNLAIQEEFPFEATQLVPSGDGVPPIDATIRSNSVCFQLDVDETRTRFCSQSRLLSIQDLFTEYGQAVSEPILRAEEILVSRAEELKELVPEVIDPLLNGERSIADIAISEIESPVNIVNCQSVECPADISVAPFGPPASAVGPVVNMGILVVHRDLVDPSDAVVLQPGSYIVFSGVDDNGNATLPLMVVGVSESGDIVEPREILSSRAAFFDPETNDVGSVAISGCRIWAVCIFWERC